MLLIPMTAALLVSKRAAGFTVTGTATGVLCVRHCRSSSADQHSQQWSLSGGTSSGGQLQLLSAAASSLGYAARNIATVLATRRNTQNTMYGCGHTQCVGTDLDLTSCLQERKQAWGSKQFQQYIGMDVTSLLSVPVFIMEPFTILQKARLSRSLQDTAQAVLDSPALCMDCKRSLPASTSFHLCSWSCSTE
jgi:hypothetical protein